VSPDVPSQRDTETPEKRRKTEGGAVAVTEPSNGAPVEGVGLSEGVGGKPDEAAFWSSLEATPAVEESPSKVSELPVIACVDVNFSVAFQRSSNSGD